MELKGLPTPGGPFSFLERLDCTEIGILLGCGKKQSAV